MESIPKRPGGSDHVAKFLQWVYDTLLASRITSIQGGTIVRGTRGVSIVIERQRPVNASVFPFKIMLGNPDPESEDEDAWRTFRVRAGAVGTTAVEGTDGADTNPDDMGVNPTPGYDADIDFTIPSGQAKHSVWIDLATTPPSIDHGTTVPTADYLVIAEIDTDTHESESLAIIRQYLRTDVPTFEC